MSIFSMLQNAAGGEGLTQLADRFGIDAGQARELAGMLAPAIGSAARKRAGEGGLDAILGALKGEGDAAYFDDPAKAAEPEARARGMDFLGTILGGKDQASALAGEAAQRTGIDLSVIMRFLPALAAMIQGGLQKNMPDSDIDSMLGQLGGEGGLGGLVSGALGSLMGGGGPDLGQLGKLLDADGDGSPLDDVMDRFFK